jgi:hypothetical protein
LARFLIDQLTTVEGAGNGCGGHTCQTGNVGHLDFFLVWDCLDHGCLTPEPLIIKHPMSSFATVQAFKKNALPKHRQGEKFPWKKRTQQQCVLSSGLS